MIDHIALSAQQKEFCFARTKEVSELLNKWGLVCGKRKEKWLRLQIFKRNRVDVLNEDGQPIYLLEEFQQDCKTIRKLHEEPEDLLRGMTVELALLHGYANLVKRIASRWNPYPLDVDYTEMLSSECMMAMIDSIYCFRRDVSSFLTFCWRSLNNRMILVNSKSSRLSGRRKEDRDILVQFEKRFERGDITYDELVLQLGLDEEEQKILSQMLCKVASASDIFHENSEHHCNDYTALRVQGNYSDPSDLLEIQSAIESANLSKFERACFETSLNPYHGWKTDIAKDFVNPRTNKEYTRAAAGVALKSAQRKIQELLSRAA